MPIDRKLSRELKRFRKATGFSVARIADLCGVSPGILKNATGAKSVSESMLQQIWRGLEQFEGAQASGQLDPRTGLSMNEKMMVLIYRQLPLDVQNQVLETILSETDLSYRGRLI